MRGHDMLEPVSGDSVQLGVAAGALTMGANATVLGRTQVTLASAQDMAITRVLAAGPDAQVALTSGGVLRDVSGAEPGQPGGWNIEVNGTVSQEALAIGEAGNDFDVRTIDRFEATAEIVMRRGPIPRDNLRAFDARRVVDTVGPTVVLPGQERR